MLCIPETLGRKLSGQSLRRRFSAATLRKVQPPQTVAQTLPEDVLNAVLAYVDDQKTLRNCTLLCRAWYPASSCALLRAVVLVEKERSMWKRRKSTLKLFGAQLQASSWIPTALRSLVITGPTNFCTLQHVLPQLKALRNLSFIDASFLCLFRNYELLEPCMDLDVLVIQDVKLSRDDYWPGTPHIFQALRWFRNIDTFVLRGTIMDVIRPLGSAPPTTHVQNMQVCLKVWGSRMQFSEILPALGSIVVADSVKTVTFEPMMKDMFFRSLLGRYFGAFGRALHDCTLCFDLYSPRSTSRDPDMFGTNPATTRSQFLNFGGLPALQRLCLRFNMKVNGSRIHSLATFWKNCIAGLDMPFSVLEIHFNIGARSPNIARMLLDAIEWACLNELVSKRQPPPVIKFVLSCKGFPCLASYEDVIKARVSGPTRLQLVFATEEHCVPLQVAS